MTRRIGSEETLFLRAVKGAGTDPATLFRVANNV